MTGSENNDGMFMDDGGNTAFASNNAGGILGGITNAMPVTARLAFKPTPSISKAQNTIDLVNNEDTRLEITGRHDPCVVIRAVPVIEAVAALCALDLVLEGK